jgi:hypothetical protein
MGAAAKRPRRDRDFSFIWIFLEKIDGATGRSFSMLMSKALIR